MMSYLQDTGNGTVQRLPCKPSTSGDRIRITEVSTGSSDIEFWVSGPEAIDEPDGDWGVSIFANKDVFLATLVYPSQEAANAARALLPALLKEAIFIATSES
jgi:hypothetical protein